MNTLHREGRGTLGRTYWYIDATCCFCGEVKPYSVDALIQGGTTKCSCTRAVKYGKDPRAESLGKRYDAMVQRCKEGDDANIEQRKNYGHRGIKCLFESREHYIKYILKELPHNTYAGVDIDRKDNEGNYEPGNVRLTTRSVNLRNTRRNRYYKVNGVVICAADVHREITRQYPLFIYAKATVKNKLWQGLTLEEIIEQGVPKRRLRRKRRTI